MIKQTINYTDFNGNPQTQIVYFHMAESEWFERVAGEDFTWIERVQEMISTGRVEVLFGTREGRLLVDFFKSLILKAYGLRSEDGKRFVKSEELSNDFYQTAAYDAFFMSLISDAEKMALFVNALAPSSASGKITAEDLRKGVDSRTDQRELNKVVVPQLEPEQPVADAPVPPSQQPEFISFEEWEKRNGK